MESEKSCLALLTLPDDVSRVPDMELIDRITAKAEALAPGEQLYLSIFCGIRVARSNTGHLYFADGDLFPTRRRGDALALLRDCLERAQTERNANDAYKYRREIERVAA